MLRLDILFIDFFVICVRSIGCIGFIGLIYVCLNVEIYNDIVYIFMLFVWFILGIFFIYLDCFF